MSAMSASERRSVKLCMLYLFMYALRFPIIHYSYLYYSILSYKSQAAPIIVIKSTYNHTDNRAAMLCSYPGVGQPYGYQP